VENTELALPLLTGPLFALCSPSLRHVHSRALNITWKSFSFSGLEGLRIYEPREYDIDLPTLEQLHTFLFAYPKLPELVLKSCRCMGSWMLCMAKRRYHSYAFLSFGGCHFEALHTNVILF
jgi:hypothetical protein